MLDMQKASYAKRLFAWLTDLIIASIIVTGIYFLMSALLGTDRYSERYNSILESYEEEYGVTFDATEETYAQMSESEKENYRAAVDAMNADEEANEAISAFYTYMIVIFVSGIALAMLILEFVLPLIFGDGRTIGKKLFGLGVMRTGFTKVSAPVVFVRGVIGKGVMELILPIFILFTVGTGTTGIFGLILLGVFAIAEVVILIRSSTNQMLHDVIADTAVIDWQSQMIFDSAEARDEYIKAREAEKEGSSLY